MRAGLRESALNRARDGQAGRAPKAAKISFGLLEQLDFGLLQRDVTGKRLKPREHVVPVLGDVLEEQRVALDMHMGLGICQTDLPVSRRSTSKVPPAFRSPNSP